MEENEIKEMHKKLLNEEYVKWLEEMKDLACIYPKTFPECYIEPVLRTMRRMRAEQ